VFFFILSKAIKDTVSFTPLIFLILSISALDI